MSLTAFRFEVDLGKGSSFGDKRFRIEAPMNIGMITAYANDESVIFKEPLKNRLKEGDIVIGINCSGNSKNILEAIEYANSLEAKTISFIGFEGGKLKDLQIENAHLIICHLLHQYLRELIRNE